MKLYGLTLWMGLVTVLSGCGPMTQEDIASIRGSLNSFQAQNNRFNAQTFQMVQEGQRNMPTVVQTEAAPTKPQGYTFKRSNGVTVYCIELTDHMVTCKPI